MADLAVSDGGILTGSASKAAKSAAEPQDIRRQVLAECEAMACYAFGNGLKIPPAVSGGLHLLEPVGPDPSLADLTALHAALTEVVAPARPRTILLLQQDRRRSPALNALGPLPNLRFLMGAAVGFTVLFVTLALSPVIDGKNMAANFYNLEGLTLLTVMMFLMSAAGVGACFNALFKAYTYIGDNTYDTRYDSSYWIRIGLGIMAGLLLSELIPLDGFVGEGEEKHAPDLGKPLLALLGGFSATLVYTVLSRLVDTVQSLFSPTAEKSSAELEQDVRAKVEQQAGQNRLTMAASLVALQDAMAKGTSPAELQQMISRSLDGMVPGFSAATAAAKPDADSAR